MRMPRLVLLLAVYVFAVAARAQSLPGLTITGNTFTYDAPDGQVTGIIRIPSGSGPFPAVLISHGKGGSATVFSQPHAAVLVSWGFVCIGPNYTHAGSNVNTPDNEGYCPENSRRARRCLDILASMPSVDLTRVAAFGHSMGSFLTGGLLGEIPGQFRAACISAGGTSGTTSSGVASPSTIEVSGVTKPFLMFHGTADTTVPPSQSAALQGILNTNGVPNKRMLYQGIGHDIVQSNVKLADIHGIMRAWFTQHGVLAFPGNTAPTILAPANVNATAGAASTPVPITLGDGETNAESLTVSAFTTDDARLPNSGLALGGSGANRTLTITPTAGLTGNVDVVLVVHDGLLSAVTYLQVTIQSGAPTTVNHRPTISWIADQRATPGAAIAAIPFTVGDAETAANTLSVTVTSSNTTLLPVANIALTTGSANRTATLTPVNGQTGIATVTLTASDGAKNTATSFTLTVAATIAGNTAPVIQGIANEVLPGGATYGSLPLIIKDTESTESALTLSAASSNPTLVPTASVVFGGQSWGRTVTVTPMAGQTGRSTITLTVSDGANTASTSFVLDVLTGNSAPGFALLPSFRTENLGDTPQAVDFAVTDAETGASDLRVTATSSNTALVPNAGLALGGSGVNRTLIVNPTSGATGAATITLAVSDGDIIRRTQLLYVVVNPTAAAVQFSRPRGVFILDGAAGGNYTATFGRTISLRDAGIRDLPFVDGFTLRVAWDDVEGALGQYDFFIIQNAFAKLPAGQRLSLIITPDEPTYIAATAGVDTWSDAGLTRAKPWDPYLRERRRALLAALSAFVVEGVPLAEHPRLDLLDPYLPGGFTGIRDPNSTQLRNIAGYTRLKFLGAVQDELRALQDAFPGKFVQLGFWPIIDNENASYGGVTAWEWIRQQLLAEFNGLIRPRVGFFMENLAARRNGPAIDPYSSTPVVGFASALNASQNATWNGFQMLGSWTRPFNDGHVNNTLNGTPNDAMETAYNTYRAEYHEMYTGDIDNPALQPALQRWHDFYASAATTNFMSDEDGDGLPLWWEQTHGFSPTLATGRHGALGNSDTDALPNLLEFYFSQDPAADSSAALPVAFHSSDVPQYLHFTYLRRTDAPWLTSRVEVTDDFTIWNSGPTYVLPLSAVPTGDGLTERVTVRVLPAITPANPRKFVRLGVERDP
jgi:dienelactone hydrolase